MNSLSEIQPLINNDENQSLNNITNELNSLLASKDSAPSVNFMSSSKPTDILTQESLKNYYTELLCAHLFRFLLMIKMIHWQTDSYAIHKTTDELYNRFNELLDELAETLQGEILSITNNNLGKIMIRDDYPIALVDQTDNSKPEKFRQLLENVQTYLVRPFENTLKNLFKNADISSILNIRDEMLAEIQKARYLVTLK